MTVKLILLALCLGMVLLAGCQYVAPPGGEDSYCYRVDYEPAHAEGGGVILFTDIEPTRVGHRLLVKQAWLTFNRNDDGAAVRFDRYVEKLMLDDQLTEAGGIKVTGQRPCY